MQTDEVYQESESLFDMDFMGKLYFILSKPQYFSSVIRWRHDNHNIFEVVDKDNFAWTIVPFLITRHANIYTWTESASTHGFNPIYIPTVQNRLWSKEGINSKTEKRDWVIAWQVVRVKNYFNKSYMGILFNWIEDQRFQDWLRWDAEGDSIEISNFEKFVQEMNRNGISIREMKSFMAKFKGSGWLCRCLERKNREILQLRHPSIGRKSSLEVWLNCFESSTMRSRFKHRIKKETKIVVEKTAYPDNTKPVLLKAESRPRQRTKYLISFLDTDASRKLLVPTNSSDNLRSDLLKKLPTLQDYLQQFMLQTSDLSEGLRLIECVQELERLIKGTVAIKEEEPKTELKQQE